MTIMVDELRLWPTRIRCFQKGSCHLTTDTEIEGLHTFALDLGHDGASHTVPCAREELVAWGEAVEAKHAGAAGVTENRPTSPAGRGVVTDAATSPFTDAATSP